MLVTTRSALNHLGIVASARGRGLVAILLRPRKTPTGEGNPQLITNKSWSDLAQTRTTYPMLVPFPSRTRPPFHPFLISWNIGAQLCVYAFIRTMIIY